MSDLISRQAAIDALCETCTGGREDCALYPYCAEIDAINCLPSAQQDHIAKVGKMDCISRQAAIDGKISIQRANGVEIYSDEAVPIEYLKRLPSAETQWIPCSERLPEEPFGCLVTVWDTDPVTMDEFENILPYFVGWDGEQWNDADGLQCPFEVIAWIPLPEPYEGDKNEQNQVQTRKANLHNQRV